MASISKKGQADWSYSQSNHQDNCWIRGSDGRREQSSFIVDETILKHNEQSEPESHTTSWLDGRRLAQFPAKWVVRTNAKRFQDKDKQLWWIRQKPVKT